MELVLWSVYYEVVNKEQEEAQRKAIRRRR